jgi:hypothetical protein
MAAKLTSLLLVAAASTIVCRTGATSAAALQPAAEESRHCLRVRIPPVDLGRRARDEMPAEFRLVAADFAKDRRLDPASLQVVRHDPVSGKDPGALPLRWYDEAIPYDFPECEQNIHATDGVHLAFVTRPRWGDFYNVLGDGRAGRLVWTHTQHGK